MTDIEKKLLKSFDFIYKNKMQNIPIINQNLKVETIGFQNFLKYELGVLITPWFMNIILAPRQKNDIYPQENKIRKIIEGRKIKITLPQASYNFLIQSDDILGFYLSCSLFSPMLDFENQQQAVDVAKEIMLQLLISKKEMEYKKNLTRRDFFKIENVD